METASGYGLAQVFGLPTIRRYRAFVREHVPSKAGRHVLEIGCGIGSARSLLGENYTGIDINPDYIEKARRRFSGNYFVMDAAAMPFKPNTFDDAVSIATAHHLSDEQLASMVRKAVTIAMQFHIIDAILPISPSRFKTALFRMDRGRHIRTFERLCNIVRQNARLETSQAVTGPLHDVCYIRASAIIRLVHNRRGQ